MTSVEFIKQRLNELVNIFPTIKCAYEFDNFDNTHIVEVMPSEFYNNSQSFYQVSETINNEFIDKFPFEGLFFIDDTDLMPISNVIYEVKGRDYEVKPIYSFATPQTICIPKFNSVPNFLNNTDIASISSNIIKQAFTINSLFNGSSDMHREILGYIKVDSLSEILEKEPMGEISYAMAA